VLELESIDKREDLMGWLGQFRHAGGTAILITHRLREALSAADEVVVLRRGATTLSGKTTGPVRNSRGRCTRR